MYFKRFRALFSATTKTVQNMKPSKIQPVENFFTIGELYLFHKRLPSCPAESSLWGMFDRIESGAVYLESSSLDLYEFRLWHRLSSRYRYCRLATRAELRDYVSALTWYEVHKSPPKKPYSPRGESAASSPLSRRRLSTVRAGSAPITLISQTSLISQISRNMRLPANNNLVRVDRG